MAIYNKDGVKFSGIREPINSTGGKIGTSNKYNIDENGNIIDVDGKRPSAPIINAIDIDWNNATTNGVGPIKTTTDLIKAIARGGGGDPNSIPVYDTDTIDELRENNSLPNKYISVDNSLDSNNSLNMIHSLMTIVTGLQQEITKIKNTFNKGIYSYNGEATYMSSVVAQYGDVEEPLWAIDESELDTIDGFEFDYENNNSFADNGILEETTENRMYAYITAPSDVNIILKSKNTEETFEFNISDYITCEKCNIMILISRKPVTKNYPINFVYIDVTDYNNNKTLLSGYINNDKQIVINETGLEYRYYFSNINLLSGNYDKFNIYVQNKSFGNEVIPVTPNNDETSYRVAHIAVRTAQNSGIISKIKNQLVNGEFIIDEETEKLYLKINNKIINIGAGSGDIVDPDDPTNPDDPIETDTMENYEIIQALESQGLLSVTFKNSSLIENSEKYSPSNIESYKINNIGSVRFTHEDTGKTFEYKTNAYGELESKLIEDSTTLAEKLQGTTLFDDFKSSRGFVGQLGYYLSPSTPGWTDDYGLYSDRIKIGAIYAPLHSDVTYGCSHAFIELENTSNIDFNLQGCKLHYIKKSDTSKYYIKYSLDLTGIIPAGGTYLIRGKKYIQNDADANCYIHVDSYDQEWYVNGELLDLTMNNTEVNKQKIYGSYVLILSYHGKQKVGNSYIDFLSSTNMLYKLGLDINEITISENSDLGLYLGQTDKPGNLTICAPNDGKTVINGITCQDANDSAIKNAPLVYAKGFIDALAFNKTNFGITSAFDTLKSNTICRGTYELDPAKQAYNSLTKRDSSRHRWEKKGNDYQYLSLEKKYIEFPKSPVTRNVDYYAPKASFEHKNVITDKTRFDKEKPNAVTVSYGENVYTTRCFNWLSASNVNEYVWLYNSNGDQIGVFESYKYTKTDISQSSSFPRRKEFSANINNIVYCDYRTNTVLDRSNNNKDVTYAKYATAPRACGLFAGSNDFFVSHKCIIDVVENPVNEETTYSYIVGQADKNNKPLEGHCSERRYFTLYPDTYTPVIYQITDQQGFHWIEYQVWTAAAESLNQRIMSEMETAKQNGNPIMPIIINTGDATQSGSRINEWLDYFIAGDCLFNHFEQNNIVGNNDLNGTDIQALGTGDDPGKSNAYYYYLFNCNEVNNFFQTSRNYTEEEVNEYNSKLTNAVTTNDWRIEPVEGVKYTQEEIDAAQEGDDAYGKTTDDWKVEPVEGVKYTREEVNQHNAELNGAISTNDLKYFNHYPIVNNTYVPSLYYLDTNNFRLVMCNSEITPINCRDWFNLRCTPYEGDNAEYTINIYTGFNLVGNKENGVEKYVADSFGFTPLYTLLWHAFNSNRKCIAACHEMPFTVITNACCSETDKSGIDQLERFRSMSDAKGLGKLIGSHLNQMEPTENGAGVYWFSRLLESMGVKLCIGGHKHTYAISYPVREFYKYYKNGSLVDSLTAGPMEMPETLQSEERSSLNDYKVLWKWEDDTTNRQYVWYNTKLKRENDKHYDKVINWSKLPITYIENTHQINSDLLAVDKFFPATPVYTDDGFKDSAVIYIMCQATGYKLTSNKELPTPNQKFSRIIPETYKDSDNADAPDNNQKFPMYIKYIVDNVGNCNVYLARAKNIFKSDYKFTQIAYGTAPITWTYLIDKDQYNENTDLDNLDVVSKINNSTTQDEIDAVEENATKYDNYGLWLKTEKQMIPTINI